MGHLAVSLYKRQIVTEGSVDIRQVEPLHRKPELVSFPVSPVLELLAWARGPALAHVPPRLQVRLREDLIEILRRGFHLSLGKFPDEPREIVAVAHESLDADMAGFFDGGDLAGPIIVVLGAVVRIQYRAVAGRDGAQRKASDGVALLGGTRESDIIKREREEIEMELEGDQEE